MIGIIDYGMGNLHSVANACAKLNLDHIISSDPEVLETCDRLILPGVGALPDMMETLKAQKLDEWIIEAVTKKNKKLLGICLGMQALFEGSEEYGWHEALNLIPGKVVFMSDPNIRIPAIGWNEVTFDDHHPLAEKFDHPVYVYYDHSYFATDMNPENLKGVSHYGPYTVAGLVQKDNVVGTQYHPEKSGPDGLAMLEWFGREF